MPFEPVKRQGGQPAGDIPTLRVAPDGQVFSLNTKAMELLGDHKYVTILFDADARQLALEPTAAPGDYAFSVSRTPSKAGGNRGTISSASAVRAHRIETGQTVVLRQGPNGRWLVGDVGPAVPEAQPEG